jgi:Cu(I)/Ag(I) efflux system membrane fusion protein
VFVEQAHGVFSPRVVEVGPLFGDERAVTSGLEDGARVVTRGAFLLDSESRLEASLAPAKGKAP